MSRSRRASGDQSGIPDDYPVEEGTIILGRQPGEGEGETPPARAAAKK
jgi:hypothetical protein